MSVDPTPLHRLSPLEVTTTLRDEVCQLIDQSEILDLTWKDIRALAVYLDVYRVAPGSLIFQEGDLQAFACLVLDGEVEIYKQNLHAQRKTVVILGRGKFFGEMAIIDQDPRSASAVALKKTMLAILTKEKFSRLIMENPALAVPLLIKWAKGLSQRLRRASGMLVEHLEH